MGHSARQQPVVVVKVTEVLPLPFAHILGSVHQNTGQVSLTVFAVGREPCGHREKSAVCALSPTGGGGPHCAIAVAHSQRASEHWYVFGNVLSKQGAQLEAQQFVAGAI